MILKAFSGIPFVLLNLLAADPGAPAGGGGSPVDQNTLPEAEPKPEGETLESKLTSATTWIGKLFGLAKDFKSRLATSENERTKLEGQFNAAASDLTKEKEDHTKTKGELTSAKTTITGLTSERDNSNKNVERLEKLCNLRGIDPATIVPANDKPEGAAGNVWEQYKSLRDQEKAGTVKPGSSHAFYQKNSKALHEYQNAHKSE